MGNSQSEKLVKLIQYIVAEAAKNEFPNTSLGAIHIIKYVYLVDLEYAKHYGKTFTGIKWQFYNYGPWSKDLYHVIEPSLEENFIRTLILESQYGKENFKRYYCSLPDKSDEFYQSCDLVVTGAVGKFVPMFGQDTESLLEYVYNTEPILTAAPGELLNFKNLKMGVYNKNKNVQQDEVEALTIRQQKKRNEKLKKLKDKFQKDVQVLVKKQDQHQDWDPPIYDDVYEEGLNYLDSLAGSRVEETEISIKVTDEYWKSKSRFDPDIS